MTESYYYEAPVPTDVTLFQTPKRALKHKRYITSIILGTILGFFVNWGIGLAFTKGNSRVPLWSFLDNYKDENGYLATIFATPMWLELFLTIFFGVFLGAPLTTCFIRADLKQGKALPIQGNDLSKFRYLGVTFKNMWCRALYYCIPAILLTYPLLLIALEIICSSGGMKTMTPPKLDGATECYVNRWVYCLMKGFYGAIASLLISPLVEWGGLNRDNIPDETFEAYMKQAKPSDIPSAV